MEEEGGAGRCGASMGFAGAGSLASEACSLDSWEGSGFGSGGASDFAFAGLATFWATAFFAAFLAGAFFAAVFFAAFLAVFFAAFAGFGSVSAAGKSKSSSVRLLLIR